MQAERQLAAAAEREAVDQRDGRNGQPVEQREHRLTQLGAFALRRQPALLQLLDVGAGAEGLLALAGDDQRAGLRAPRFADALADPADQLEARAR